MNYKKVPDAFKDPVCGMSISKISAVTSSSYGKKNYYFCSELCRDEFETSPEKYLINHNFAHQVSSHPE